MSKNPSVELKLPILKNMELIATQSAEVVSKHMNLSEDKAGEISMAIIEACINAFEHSNSKEEIFIHFIISDDNFTVNVIYRGIGFDATQVAVPDIENKINSKERKRGWGIMLIKELMDYVHFTSDASGTTLTMVKNKEKKWVKY